ncbi:MAG: zinc-dependent alcohol dehydrogenase family protein [Betaproteobacteria bacterium]|nr:zinc-dependent alcohol dehydrogenase family protein [Betaproteobacteria bacterium]
MKALVYNGPGQKTWTDKANPVIEKPTDAIVRITKTTICGTDLHILKGDVPAVTPGRVLGHEGVGIIEETGSAVRNFKKGDHVLISCITSCGSCPNCKRQMYAHCADGGWILGHLIDGTQAEYVRIPHADNSLYPIPTGADEEALVMLSDILPTGFEIGVLYGEVGPGDVVAIVGAGPIGMASLLTAQFYSPSRIIMVDLDPNRLEVAKKFGATDVVCASGDEAVKQIMALTTGGAGVDVAIEAVGIPATFDVCQKILAPGARLANVGVHGVGVNLELEKLWIRNVTIRTGLVNTNTTPMLLKTVQSGKVEPTRLITHRFRLDQIEEAYRVFGDAAREKSLKVIMSA